MSGDESYVPSESELVQGDPVPSNIFDDPEESPDVEDYAGEKRASPEPSDDFEDLTQAEVLIKKQQIFASKVEVKAAKLWAESEDMTEDTSYVFLARELFQDYDYLIKYFEEVENNADWDSFGREFYEKFSPVIDYLHTIDLAGKQYKFVKNPEYSVDEDGYGEKGVDQWVQKKCSPSEAASILNEYSAKLMALFENEDELEKLISIGERAAQDVKNASGVTEHQDVLVDMDDMAKKITETYLEKSSKVTGNQAEAIAKYIQKDYDFLRKFFDTPEGHKYYDQFGHEYWKLMLNDKDGVLALLDRIRLARSNQQWVPRKDNPREGDIKKISASTARAIIYKVQEKFKNLLLNKRSLQKVLRLCEKTKHNYETFVTQTRKPKRKPPPKKKPNNCILDQFHAANRVYASGCTRNGRVRQAAQPS
jgi:hypothetical protein